MKYLFTAQFNDGSVFQQDPEDKHPSKPDKSSFTHLLEEADQHGGIALFQLKGGNGHTYSVDLRDGHFEIDLLKTEVQGLGDFRLIYYRQHRHIMNVQTMEELDHEIEFHLGWQTTHEGKNVQQILMIK